MKRKEFMTSIVKRMLIIFTVSVFLSGCGQKDSEPSVDDDVNLETEIADEVADTEDEIADNAASTGDEMAVAEEINEPQDENESSDDMLPAYRDILDRLYLALSEGPVDGEYPVGTEDVVTTGIMENGLGAQPGEGLNEFGYCVLDLNGDGKDELIIGEYPQGGTYIPGNFIYAVYGEDAGEAVLIVEGWARNRWYLLEDNVLYNEGSGGAMYTIVGKYMVSEDGHSLDCKEYYFTDYADETQETIGVFTNTTAEWDVTKSTLSDMTDADLWVMMETCENSSVSLGLTSMYDYGNPLTICNEDAYTGEMSLVNWVSLDSAEYQAHVVCVPKEDIFNVVVKELTFIDFDEAGKPTYEKRDVYSQDKLTESLPLGLDLTIGEVIPTYSISFSTADGKTYEFAIEESGESNTALLLAME